MERNHKNILEVTSRMYRPHNQAVSIILEVSTEYTERKESK